jgi:hypothetical protein
MPSPAAMREMPAPKTDKEMLLRVAMRLHEMLDAMSEEQCSALVQTNIFSILDKTIAAVRKGQIIAGMPMIELLGVMQAIGRAFGS